MERSLQAGISVSLLAHAAILSAMAGVRAPVLRERPKALQVKYYRPAERLQPPPAPGGGGASSSLPVPAAPAAARRARPAPAATAPLEPHAAGGALRQKPRLPDSINLSNLTQLSSSAVAYVDYFRLLRERIRETALRRYPARNVQGEVFLTFTVTADGAVTEAHVVEARSTPEAGLRTAGLESLREASPFPPFPGTLNRPQMTFHIIIAYELER